MGNISGLVVGIVFGIILKKSRFCFTGRIRDIYLEKDSYNIVLIIAIISTEGFLYQLFGHLGLITIPSYLPPFSLVSVALGSFIFGIGAVMMNGCITSSLVKCGDGRIIGWLSIAVFLAVGYFFSAGRGIAVTDGLRKLTTATDNISLRRSWFAVVMWGMIAVISYFLMFRYRKKHKAKFSIPSRYTGIRHIICEKTISPEIAAICIGLVLGITFLVSEQIGRHHGLSVAVPLLSWVYTITNPIYITGGCNYYDQTFGWGSLLVLGIVIGVFISTLISEEFSIVMPAKRVIVKSIVGSAFMGAGSMWGLGCLLSNGYVGTAQLSLKSWYAFLFIVLGIWTGTKIFLVGIKRS
ncbi:MAG: YeeE/YedE family protein [Synergistaceae bacterium]|nr:YeeE/YedE family protein [Synergistaceae bacterium]